MYILLVLIILDKICDEISCLSRTLLLRSALARQMYQQHFICIDILYVCKLKQDTVLLQSAYLLLYNFTVYFNMALIIQFNWIFILCKKTVEFTEKTVIQTDCINLFILRPQGLNLLKQKVRKEFRFFQNNLFKINRFLLTSWLTVSAV